MKKADIIDMLKPFDDQDDIQFNGNITKLFTPSLICGKRQVFMAYKCVLLPNHKGLCYCACKDIEFQPDEIN